MKQLLILFLVIFLFNPLGAQQKPKGIKYPSVFWEITGNGLKKPSYLFGTMHVSSKVAFHLSDSFYTAIKNTDVVALETNPETWQEDMNNFDVENYDENSGNGSSYDAELPEDYLTRKSLRIGKYEKKLELALFSKPQIINNLLYRSQSDNSSDFEEDTYLDLYIYQTGKRMGKRVAGVENYAESMRLMMEAFRDAAKERNRKEISYDIDEDYSPDKLQEAYRNGNLDQLDSINRLSSQSDAFDEKFLYRRNEIQANSIDSILKKSGLFVGVGAAHLPGSRGVIELLRKKGYRLRPIFMNARNGRYKEEVEKIRVPVTFTTQTSADNFFSVDIPGRFYNFDKNGFLDQQQYADMANGTYYMVTRVKTNAQFWGHNEKTLMFKIDSLLYENVPGKILSKTEINRNGYTGFDIINRTRRGDYHRYNIFITPNEVLFFKMGGNGDYVMKGAEAKKFFGSIRLQENRNGGWKNIQPAWGGFTVSLPQSPFITIGDPVQLDASDKTTGFHYTVIRTDIHNYNFAEEDSFDLNLMDESFASSEFIDKTLSRNLHSLNGYTVLDCNYSHKDGSLFFTRYLIKGSHYYALIAHGKNENADAEKFLNSFEIVPYTYAGLKEIKDTVMGFTVTSSWYPVQKKEPVEMPDDISFLQEEEDEFAEDENYKTRLIRNDTTGEAVFISFYKYPKYYRTGDSSELNAWMDEFSPDADTTWIIRSQKKTIRPNGMLVNDRMVSDTNSSRCIWSRTFYKDGISFLLLTQTDTLGEPGSFIKNFFESFTPADTLKGVDPFEKKSMVFFTDFFSGDSVRRNRAIHSITDFKPDSVDLPELVRAIQSFTWSDKKYLEKKTSFIAKLGSIPTNESAGWLKTFYENGGDTLQILHTSLEALLKQRTTYSYQVFRDIMTNDPPVLQTGDNSYGAYNRVTLPLYNKNYWRDLSNGNFLDELYDSLPLTQTILPDLLPLLNLEDYELPLMRLMQTMVDSNLLQAKDYEMYLAKFLLEAKQKLKKQNIDEKTAAIEKAEEEKKEIKTSGNDYQDEIDKGNTVLVRYATLLLPFIDKNPQVNQFINQLLTSGDKRLKYHAFQLLLRNQKIFPDSLLNYFASLDDYRYELYNDLLQLNKTSLFPPAFNNHTDLSRSKLIARTSAYMKPDSIQLLDSLSINYRGKKGWVYFYRYRMKKDDASWKLATVGLIPQDATRFVFDKKENDEDKIRDVTYYPPLTALYNTDKSHGFTEFSDVKIKDDEPLADQLSRQLKKLIYSKRKSGRMFYNEKMDPYEYLVSRFRE